MDNHGVYNRLSDIYLRPERYFGEGVPNAGFTLPRRDNLDLLVINPEVTADDLKYIENRYGILVQGRPDNGNNFIVVSGDTKRILSRYSIIFYGTDNLIVIGCAEHPKGTLSGMTEFYGDGTTLIISDGLHQNSNLVFRLWHQNQFIFWGKGSTSNGAYIVAQGHNRKIIIGDDCMLSNNIWIRNSDMHAIFDITTSKRLNDQSNILIEPHVWIGQDTLVMGVEKIGLGSIIGAKSLLKTDVPKYCIYAGSPAKLIRKDVSWDRAFDVRESTLEYLKSLE